jgi:LssY C-terminus
MVHRFFELQLNLIRGFVLLCVGCASTMAFGCDELPPGQSIWIRLAAPVSTYSAKAGDPVHAVLTQDLVCNNEIILPMGAAIDGFVRSKRKVGWGIRHETAALELEFNRAITGTGETVALTARVEEVENARESVRKGVIQGIRSTNTFQGSINSRLIHLPTWNPYSDPVLIAYKAVFPIFPEPEIYYPAGTDIRLRTTKEISALPAEIIVEHESLPTAKAESDEFDQMVEPLPWRVTTRKHIDSDLLNIIFLGSEDQVKSAFRKAGWHNADPVSKHAWMMNLYALLNNSGYAQQPMMTFLMNDKPEDMNWQKNLNSYGRRDHLRIWQWSSDGATDPIWVASSTHDAGVALAVKYKGFVHHISPNIDDERSTVIRDLNFAGCVKSVTYVARPEVPTSLHNATGDLMRTDGSVAVVGLQECQRIDPQFASDQKGGSFRPGNYVFRYIRKQILTFRNDMFRANIIYGAYDVGRMTVMAMRKPAIQ